MNFQCQFNSFMSYFQRSMYNMAAIVALLFICLISLGMAQAQVSNFSQGVELVTNKADWDLDDTAKFLSNGKLHLSAAEEKPEDPQAMRLVDLPPATAWEAQLRFSMQSGATGAGLSLLSVDERWINILLNPAQRRVQMIRGNSLTDDLVVLMNSDNISNWVSNGDQVLKVRSDGGKIQVWLNGQELGFGTPYDFEPQYIALRSEGGASQFSSINWRATGVDGRLARLSGTVLIPGRPFLMEEKFSSSAKELVGGLMGGLMSKITGKKEDSNTDNWPKNWRDEESAFTRDTSTKRLTLTGLKDGDYGTWVSPNSLSPLDEATVAITARVKFLAALVPNASGGLYLEDSWRSGKSDDQQGNLLYVNMLEGKLRLEQFNAKTGAWTLLHGYLWPYKDKNKEVELRLVVRGGSAWVFVDRHLVMSQSLEGMNLGAISGGGMRVGGLGIIEANSFRIDEL